MENIETDGKWRFWKVEANLRWRWRGCYKNFSHPIRRGLWGGRTISTTWLLQMTSNGPILGSLSILGFVFGHVSCIRGCLQFSYLLPYLVSHVTRTQNHVKSHSLHISVEIMTMGRVYWGAKSVAWICWNLH